MSFGPLMAAKPRAVALLLGVLIGCCAPLHGEKLQKWVYIQTNLLPDDVATQVEELIIRAGKAGYDHALIADSKFSRLPEMGEKYFRHVAHLKEVAAQSGVEIVPAVWRSRKPTATVNSPMPAR